MDKLLIAGFVFFLFVFKTFSQNFRPPAVPLVTVDPYFSCWSFGDKLNEDDTRHWTGKKHSMHGVITVDGKAFSFMGLNKGEKAKQINLKVNPTQSLYNFQAGPLNLKLSFTTPLLMDDLDILSRPVTYISFEASSNDQKAHEVEIYFDVTANWVIDQPDQEVVSQTVNIDGLDAMKMGSRSQKILAKKGDDTRIDWGYIYMAARKSSLVKVSNLEAKLKTESSKSPTLSMVYKLGKIDSKSKTDYLMLAYDDIYSVEYFHRKLRPWWHRSDTINIEKILLAATRDYESLNKKCQQFDVKMIEEAKAAGGEEYAAICALAYRQAIAAHKLVADSAGTPLFFSKENFSNGSIGTVDVTYPSAPLFLLYNPTLLKGMMEPIFYYSESGRWKKNFAAHDLGTYPIANGQTYPEDMPIEECGNMLILTALISEVEKNPAYAQKHWSVLSLWAEYIKKDGFDCTNQLCTDDFAGHLARNSNLSVKTIVALACYARLAKQLGHEALDEEYRSVAEHFAEKWIEKADDGDHFSLAFELKGTWSQKYNLVWDKLLGLNLFPKEQVNKEIKFYLSHQNKYGLPLDSRKSYTKSDWIFWTATLADSRTDFEKFTHPVYNYINESSDRIPLSDWHETTDGKSAGFRARSVVGGYFIKILEQKLKGSVSGTTEKK